MYSQKGQDRLPGATLDQINNPELLPSWKSYLDAWVVDMNGFGSATGVFGCSAAGRESGQYWLPEQVFVYYALRIKASVLRVAFRAKEKE